MSGLGDTVPAGDTVPVGDTMSCCGAVAVHIGHTNVSCMLLPSNHYMGKTNLIENINLIFDTFYIQVNC